MQTIFVSYSHAVSPLADRLVTDLRESEVPATYDKWILRVGDSIIERISDTLSGSDGVIALLSPNSVKSNWVKKEPALAMTGEGEKHGIKVLPALIADCDLPPMLSDKLYADFRYSYYSGLRQPLQALLPEFYAFEKFIRRERIEKAGQDLQNFLSKTDIDGLRNWFSSNGYALAAIFGKLWSVSEAIPRFKVGNDIADFLIINGQSFRYEFSLIRLGNPTWNRVNVEELVEESEKMQGLVKAFSCK